MMRNRLMLLMLLLCAACASSFHRPAPRLPECAPSIDTAPQKPLAPTRAGG